MERWLLDFVHDQMTRWAALAHPGGSRRLHPRMPGAAGRRLNLGHSGSPRARQERRRARSARRHRFGQWHRADLDGDPGLVDRQNVAWHYIAPGKPVQNAFIESFNGRLRDELLKETLFRSLPHARVALDSWRWD